jgi:hypothetical protein
MLEKKQKKEIEATHLVFNVVIDRTFGSAELFGRTSTVRFGPNDRTFFCRTQNFFSILHSMPMAWYPFHHWSLGNIAKRGLTEPKLE